MRQVSAIATFVATLGICTLCSQPWASADGEASPETLEAVSFFEAYRGNLLAIDSFDVLMSETDSFMSEGRVTREVSRKTRLLLDSANDARLFAQSTEIEEDNGKPNERILGAGWRAAVMHLGKVTEREFPGNIEEFASLPEFAFNRSFTLPEIRLIGIYPFPPPNMGNNWVENQLDVMATARPGYSVTESGKDGVYIAHDFSKVSEEGDTKREWVFSVDGLVVKSYRLTIYNKVTKRWVPHNQELIKWESIGGVFVPVSISGEQRVASRKKDGTIGINFRLYDVEFDWRSVNQEMDPTRFDSQLVVNLENVRNLVSAEASD
ncbi:hypothetical protein [Crateriforma spongiae]|uniref:hypothetical protein n=1 Tax=Crateriforma spongiae TaxID=2724528 RepID=UPI001445FFB5|nr:hypothetical protein [Crateriforma spongiae]